MGQFRVMLTVYPWNQGAPRSLEVLVDSGAGYSVMPRALLEAWGCQPGRNMRVVFADGRSEDWPITEIGVGYADRRTTTTVLMGPAGSATLLGSFTLQGLGLGIDPMRHLLVPLESVYI